MSQRAVAGVALEPRGVTLTPCDACVSHPDTPRRVPFIWYAVCMLVHAARKHFKDEELFVSMHDSSWAVWPGEESVIHRAGHEVCDTDVRQERDSFCPLQETDASFKRRPNAHSVGCCRKSVNLSCFARRREKGSALSRRGKDWFPSVSLKTNMTLTNFAS